MERHGGKVTWGLLVRLALVTLAAAMVLQSCSGEPVGDEDRRRLQEEAMPEYRLRRDPGDHLTE
jgi:hypothetical protein